MKKTFNLCLEYGFYLGIIFILVLVRTDLSIKKKRGRQDIILSIVLLIKMIITFHNPDLEIEFIASFFVVFYNNYLEEKDLYKILLLFINFFWSSLDIKSLKKNILYILY